MNILQTLQRLTAAALLSVAVSAPADAHHSIAAFDGRQTVQITGIVKQFLWINPHVTVEIEGTGDETSKGLWSLEMSAPNAMMDEGWLRDTLAIGDKITIIANPLRNPVKSANGSLRLLYVGIQLPNGKSLGRVKGER